jgi:DNA (cytosine-5)-methyltransferase 1
MRNNDFLDIRSRAGLSQKEVADLLGVTLYQIKQYDSGKKSADPEKISLILKQANLGKSITLLPKSDFRFIDLFAGIGGFRRAFDSVGGECVFTSEWNEFSRKTYLANYSGSHPVVGDIKEFTRDLVSLDKIPEHDVLVAGFPCQPFSIAGVSKNNALGRAHGFRDEAQGTLFFDLVQILDRHKPAAFLLENVKNLVGHDKGNTFRVIKGALEIELGYKIYTKVIDGQSWVPQHRERIFIVGFPKGYNFDFKNLVKPDPMNKPVLGDILHSKDREPDEAPFFVDGKVADKYTLTPGLWEYLQNYKEKHRSAGNGFGFGLCGPGDVARTLSARYYKDGSEILIKQKGKRPRRLTPRECSRLMGFDSPTGSEFKIPVSDSQAYKQFGNSVIVPVASAIARLMKPFIMQSIRNKKAEIGKSESTSTVMKSA